MMNLFWSTRALTAAREDHLTEFFAAALHISQRFRAGYCDLALGEFLRSAGSCVPAIQDITTQVRFPGTTCCPDMVLTLSDGRQIACEHKLDAIETMGPEQDKREQLIRYLDLPVDGVLYVRSSWKPPQADVVSHPKYIRPPNREHFLWRDFYHLLDLDDTLFLRWLKEGFERLGFTPPHPSVGAFEGPDSDANTRNRRNFAKLWVSTRTFAHELGWRVGAGSIVELYMWSSPSPLASNLFVSPVKFGRFLIRVTPRSGKLNATLAAMRAASARQPIPTEVQIAQARRKNGKVSVVDLTTSLFEILGKEPQAAEEMERKLFTYVTHFLAGLQG